MPDEPPIVLVDAVSASLGDSAGVLVQQVPEAEQLTVGDIGLPALTVTATSPHMAYIEGSLPALTAEVKTGHSFAITLPSLALEATATPARIASGDFSLPSFMVAGKTGWQFGFKLPLMDITGEILPGSVASGEFRLPLLDVTAVAGNGFTASGDLDLPRITATIEISEGRAITGTITVPLLQVTGSILMGLLAEADITLPMLTVDANAYEQGTAQGNITLPLLQVAGHIAEVVVIVELDGTTSSLTGYALAMNVENNGISEYTNFNFNSFANFQGKYLAAGTGGIFELTGDNDNETDIDALIRTGQEDGGTSLLKRPEDAYVGVKTDDVLEASVVVDGNIEYDGSPIDPRTDGIGTQKVKFGKGIKSRYWSLQIKNTNGCNFEVESAELVLKPVERKI